jgi:hypothetical protein
MNITLNGSTITVYRNNVQVSTATDAFNSSATVHGCIYEPTTSTNYPSQMKQAGGRRTRTSGKAVRPSGKRRIEPGFGQATQGSIDVPERQPRQTRRKPPLQKRPHEILAPPPPVVLPPTPPDRIKRRRPSSAKPAQPRRREQK